MTLAPPPSYNVLGKSDYTPAPDLPQKVLGWALEANQEGDYYLRNQQGYGRSKTLRALVYGDDRPFREGQLSQTSDNETGRLFGVSSADLTDWEPYWQYESFNEKYEQQVRIQSAYLTSWFPRYGERPTELIVKNALLDGAGVGALTWDCNRQDIALESRNAHDVKPIRPFGDTGSFQDCFAVSDQREMPVNTLRSAFPHAARYIHAERDASLASQLAQAGSRVFRGTPLTMNTAMVNPPAARLGALPVLDVFHLYVDDQSVNEEPWAVEMGDWGDGDGGRRIPLNDWSYKVESGDPLYPLKRLIIHTRSLVLYDGPSIYWHGMFPYSKLVLDTVPSMWFGSSAFWRLIPLQRSLDRLYRAIDDRVALMLEPGKMAPKLGVAESELRKFRTNLPGQSIRYGPGGKPEQIPVEPIDPSIQLQIDRILARMQQHVGVQQLTNLASLGQVPEGETIEKILSTLQPEVRARSRAIESFQRDLGVMFAYDVAQFIPVGRRIQMFGADGATPQDFDIDRYSLVPAYVDSDYLPGGGLRPEVANSPRPRFDRAREFMRPFSLNIKPASMLNSAKTTERLLTLTMRRQGDMPLYATLKKLGYQNLGPEPKSTLIDQITQEKAGLPPAGSAMNAQVLQAAQMLVANPQMMQAVMAMQQIADGMGGGGDPNATPPGGGGNGGLGNPGTGSSQTADDFGPHRGPGHPPSAQEMPHQRPDGRLEESS